MVKISHMKNSLNCYDTEPTQIINICNPPTNPCQIPDIFKELTSTTEGYVNLL